MKPIIFNTEMVKAIIEGRKTVTRRLIKAQPNSDWLGWIMSSTIKENEGCASWYTVDVSEETEIRKPPYKIGDTLYVRETWSKDTSGEYVYRTNYGTTDPWVWVIEFEVI